ncbi:MAG: leucine-rich repeat protein, partial [Prolixibacteraceae bacterium]|nr:leucine-rich repeat protein [Prolixibacteraceae bacterium]
MKTKILQKSKHIILSSILCIAVAFTATAQSYTLTDDDVVVENGVITSCSYNFAIKDIIIPETLDGQTVTGIADKSKFSGVFYRKGITSVKLPQSIQNIGENAFYQNYSITLVDLSNCSGLMSIGTGAFRYNLLTTLNLSNCTSLTSIGDYAFSNNSLTTLDLSNCKSLTNIEEGGFKDNSLTALVFNGCTALTGIGSSAFAHNLMTTLDLLSCTSLTSIGDYAFSDNLLTTLKVNGCSALTSIENGAFSNNSLTTLDLSNCKSLTNIEEGAFEDNSLTALDLNSCTALTSIGGSAFEDNSLTALDLNSCTALTSIGGSAFRSNSLTTLDLRSCTSLTSIGYYAFSNNLLTTLKVNGCSALTSIDSYAFKNNSLTRLDLSNCKSLTKIGWCVFEDNSLTTLDLSNCTALTEIGAAAFADNSLTTLDLSNCTALTGIERSAFIDNLLTTLDLSSCISLTSIGSNAFRNNSLITLDLSNCAALTGIGDYAFINNSLTSLNLSNCNALTGIGDVAFKNNSLTTLDLSSCTSLTNIGIYAFSNNSLTALDLSNCTALTEIGVAAFADNSLTTLDLSNCTSLISIGSRTFKDNSLTSFTLPVNTLFAGFGWRDPIGNTYSGGDVVSDLSAHYYIPVPYLLTDDDVVVENGVIVSCTYNFTNKKIIIPKTIDGQTVTGIGSSVFRNKGINYVSLPTTIEKIGNYAFEGNSLESLDLSNCPALTYIGIFAFDNNKLTSLTLPVNLQYTSFGWKDGNDKSYIGEEAVSNLKICYYIPAPYTLTNDDVVIEGGVIISCSYNFGLKTIIIPKILDGQTVTGIADATSYLNGIFYNKGICSIMIPPTIESIGDYAFYQNFLITLDLNDCSALTRIGEFAFNKNSLKTLDIKGCAALIDIGKYAFDQNLLPYFSLPANTLHENLGWKDKKGNTYARGDEVSDFETNYFAPYLLTDDDVEVENGVITSCSYDFTNKNIFIPENLDGQKVKGIGNVNENLFSDKGITYVSLPATIENIGKNAFLDNLLTTIDLSNCKVLRNIGKFAFDNNNLKTFSLPVNTQYADLGWEDGNGKIYTGGDEVSNLKIRYFIPFPYTLTDDDVVVENGVITYCSYNFAITHIIIPETLDGQAVTGIADDRSGVFYGKRITSVSLPSTIESIGANAFYETPMTTLDLSNCSALTRIGVNAFAVSKLTTINLSGCSALTSIGSSAFNKNLLTTLDLSNCTALMNIGRNAFSSNPLTSFILPVNTLYEEYGWTDIDDNIYAGGSEVSNLATSYDVPVYILSDDDVVVKNGVITSCSYNFANTNISIPETLDGQTVTGIADANSAYSGIFSEEGITSLHLPTTIKRIGNYAFIENSLTTLDLNGCTALISIGKKAFLNNSIESLDLSNCMTLINIGENAFIENPLTSFTLPTNTLSEEFGWTDSNGNIYTGGDEVSNLAIRYHVPVYILSDDDVVVENGVITSCVYGLPSKIIIPEVLDGQTVTSIGNETSPYQGVFCKRGIAYIKLPSTIESIGNYAFSSNSLTSLDLSNCTALTSIGNYTFSYNDITTLDLSGCSALTSIGVEAFNNNNLTSLDISGCSALTYIGGEAFLFNYLTSFNLPINTQCANFGWKDDRGNVYKGGSEVYNLTTNFHLLVIYTLTDNDVVVENGVIISCSYDFAIKNIIIPETLDGQTVTGIGNDYYIPFARKDIITVRIPATVERIGAYAFGENSLTSLDLSHCTVLTNIEEYAFGGNSIESLDLSNCKALTSIGKSAFVLNKLTALDLSGCSALTNIGEKAFNSNNLTSLNISGSSALTDIGAYAFERNSIRSLDLSGCSALTNIGRYAFSKNSLTTLNLSNCKVLTSIDSYAFMNNSLNTLNLSDCISLTNIGMKAFYDNNFYSFILPENHEYGYYYWKDTEENTYTFGDRVNNFETDYYLEGYYILKFYDWDDTELKSDTLVSGSDAIPPADPVRRGYTFTVWDTTFTNITESYDVNAEYEISTFVVTFFDWDNTELKTETVEYGSDATAPADPVREGYIFT